VSAHCDGDVCFSVRVKRTAAADSTTFMADGGRISLRERGATEEYEGFMVLSLPYETACVPGECYVAMTGMKQCSTD
jgi:hypothetical protein